MDGPERRRPKADAYLKYSGMAFQMGIIILVGALAGQKLDSRFQTERPYFTVALSLLAIFGALYVTLKDFFTGNNKS
jgi:uncharacterized membrane protein YeaQ/YmgE (transglycosylase-associated protein family)